MNKIILYIFILSATILLIWVSFTMSNLIKHYKNHELFSDYVLPIILNVFFIFILNRLKFKRKPTFVVVAIVFIYFFTFYNMLMLYVFSSENFSINIFIKIVLTLINVIIFFYVFKKMTSKLSHNNIILIVLFTIYNISNIPCGKYNPLTNLTNLTSQYLY